MTLSWSPPQADGGSPVTGYFVEKKDRFGTRWSRVNRELVSDTSLRVPGLSQGEEYQFRVVPVNKAGEGKPSEASAPTVAKAPYGKDGVPSLGSPMKKGEPRPIVHNLLGGVTISWFFA